MKKPLSLLLLLAFIACFIDSCTTPRVYYHRRGHVKYYRAKKVKSHWYDPLNHKYNKDTRRTIHYWGRTLR